MLSNSGHLQCKASPAATATTDVYATGLTSTTHFVMHSGLKIQTFENLKRYRHDNGCKETAQCAEVKE